MRRIGIIIISFLLLASCRRESLQRATEDGKGVSACFSFTMTGMQEPGVTTRAVDPSTVDDAQITDVWVLQFGSGGAFVKKTYATSVNASAFLVKLVPNNTGNLYFVVNAGATAFATDPANEAAFQTAAKTITTETDLLLSGTKKSIPMLGQITGYTVPSTGYTARTVSLTRLLARVDVVYSVDASIASSFQLDKIRVCNVPTTIQYYPPAAGNFPASPTASTMMNTAYTSVTSSATPQTLTYYLPDNRRGVGANTGTTTARLKGDLDYATYIEMTGHTLGAQSGNEIVYRIYPGADNYNDYNVVRNTHYTLTNTLKGISLSDSRVHLASANCYMLKPGGSVNIPVSRANESALGTQIANVSTGWKAAINWQTAAGLVTLDYSTYLSSGYFKVMAPSTTAKGNAEVVVTDAAGTNVLWSWHIWVTDYDPTLSANVDVLNGNTWMQYNLGATALANGSNSFATSGGLFYQWGRKDPFPNSNNSGAPIALYNATGASFTPPAYSDFTTTAVNVYVKYFNAGASPISYTNQLAYSVKYPMLFLGNWAGSTATAAADGTAAGGLNAWGGEYGDQKSVYDPCPEGWRVPSGKKTSGTWSSPWSTWLTNTSTTGVNTAYAVWASTVGYYPLSGFMDPGSGVFSFVGSIGYYWLATVASNSAYKLTLFNDSTNPGNGATRSGGFSVRCVKVW